MSKKYCYLFTEGNANMRELLGGKGANLATWKTPCWSPSAPAPGPPCPA